MAGGLAPGCEMPAFKQYKKTACSIEKCGPQFNHTHTHTHEDMEMKSTDLVFFRTLPSAGRPQVIDLAVVGEDGMLRGLCGESREALTQRYPGLRVGRGGLINSLIEVSYRTAPRQITAQAYQQALETFLPTRPQRDNGVESFAFAEHVWGKITTIYARFADTYWAFRDHSGLSAGQIALRIMQVVPVDVVARELIKTAAVA